MIAPPRWAVLLIVGLFGAAIGSFLNVVIHRMPRRGSLWWPGSHCPICKGQIRAYDNLPVLGWLLLRGRCRFCKEPISARYPLVELLTAFLFVVVARRFLGDRSFGAWSHLLAAELFTGALIAVTFIDLEHTIIPDRITLKGMVAAPVISFVVPGLHQTQWLDGLGFPDRVDAVILSLLGGLTGYFSILLVGKAGTLLFRKRLERANVEDAMGFGDVKFMAVIGGFVGPLGVLLTFLIACLLGSAVGIVSWVLTRSMLIPFGPFLSAGAFVVLLWYDRVLHFLTVTYPSMIGGG